MKEKYTIYLLIASILLFSNACRETGTNKFRSQQYAVEINTWGFGGPYFEAFLYNTGLQTYSPERRNSRPRLEQNTLYILKRPGYDEFDKTDTLKLKLTANQVDSLYILTYAHLSNFEMDNEIELGKMDAQISDGANFSVSLKYEDKAMKCTQYRLKGISRASKEAENLFKFINKKVPEEFQLY